MRQNALRPYTRKNNKQDNFSFQVIDIETMNWTKHVVSGFYDGIQFSYFKKCDDLIRFIMNYRTELNCFMHFGGGFDFLFLIEEFLKQDFEIIEIIPRGSSMLSMKVKDRKNRVHSFKDSSALLPFSLKTLTHAFNVPAKKGEWDHKKTRGFSKKLLEYLKSDCLGLYQVIETFYNDEIVGNSGRSFTIASQAQKILQTFIKDPIYAPSESANEFMREACHGGRTEIFKPIGTKLYEMDVNSLYPFVMRSNDFPAGKAVFTYRYKANKLGIYKCEIDVPKDTHIPCIPFKDEKRLIFPKGKFKSTITSAEIEYATKLGYKIKVLEGYYFTDKKPYFAEFIDFLWHIRQKYAKNTPQNLIAKLIMNSSYGKFILRLDKSNIVFKPKLGDRIFKELKVGRKNIILYERPIKLKTFSHSAIGAFILAYARIHMHKMMLPIAENVFYTDTDSIWTDLKISSSDELGALKLEKPNKEQDHWDNVCFLLPKTYIAQIPNYRKIAMKGFDKRKIKHFNYLDFLKALQGEIKLRVDHDETIAKFKTALKKGKIVHLKPAFTKEVRKVYDKRIINLKNNTSEAITL